MAKLSKEAKEAMEALGHDPEQVEGGDIDENVAEEKAGLDQPEESPPVEEAPEPVSTEEQDGPNDKTWQSRYDKTTAELEKERQALVEAEAKNEALMKMLAGVGQPKQEQPQPKQDKEPELTDFIQLDQYDKYDATDPTTASGQAYHKWQSAVFDYKQKIAFEENSKRQREASQNEVVMKQARYLASKHKEFRNPITGDPDMSRISEFIESISNSSDESLWAELYEFKIKKPGSASVSDAKQIGIRANQVSSVASQPTSEKESKPVPKAIDKLAGIYGNDIEYPIDAEFD